MVIRCVITEDMGKSHEAVVLVVVVVELVLVDVVVVLVVVVDMELVLVHVVVVLVVLVVVVASIAILHGLRNCVSPGPSPPVPATVEQGEPGDTEGQSCTLWFEVWATR